MQGECKLIMSRDFLFQESFEQVSTADPNTLRQRLMITFKGEEGLDYGGVARCCFSRFCLSILSAGFFLSRSTLLFSSMWCFLATLICRG